MAVAPPAVSARFNVRAYGIWINPRNEVLLTDEIVPGGHRITKFPGGGLEFGEGLLDCLQREWREELGVAPELIRHYYTTDFFQRSAFQANEQVLSVYYLVRLDVTNEDLAPRVPGIQLHWVSVASLEPDRLTLPIDQHVATRLRHDFGQLPSPPDAL